LRRPGADLDAVHPAGPGQGHGPARPRHADGPPRPSGGGGPGLRRLRLRSRLQLHYRRSPDAPRRQRHGRVIGGVRVPCGRRPSGVSTWHSSCTGVPRSGARLSVWTGERTMTSTRIALAWAAGVALVIGAAAVADDVRTVPDAIFKASALYGLPF